MGGGGAMRAATKVATFGVAAGLRGGASLLPLQDQSGPSSLLTTPPPRGGGAPSASIVSDAARASSFSVPIQRPRPPPPMDDDWEFAEEEEEYLLPAPRLVFGGVPTYEEAKDATSELKDAVHKEYFCNALSHSDCNEKAVVHSSVPKPIFQAFSLLTESPEAQGVVASLASDKNVWDAVMKNEKVMDFIKWQQTSSVSDIDANIEQPFPENKEDSQKSSSEEEEEYSGNELLKFVEKVKMTVTDMVSSLSGFFQSLFGVENNNNGISIDENGNASVKTGIGASFMALAVMAIMVAVLKRA